MKRIEIPSELIVRYNNGESLNCLAVIYGIGKSTIQKKLKNAGVIKPPGWSSVKYSVNENYFDVIDDEHKAYWLGIFLTDGSTSGGVRLNLKHTDGYHIKQFQKDISSDHPVKIGKKGKYLMSCLTIGNKHMQNSLMSKGIIPNDKRTCYVSSDLQRHYWRGAIDGDGCIRFQNNYSLGLIGTKETCQEFKTFCLQYIKSDAKVERVKNKKAYVFRLHGESALKIGHVLYDNAAVFLERKKQKHIENIELFNRKYNLEIIDRKIYRTCNICKCKKPQTSDNWIINRNDNVICGMCRNCFRQKATIRGTKKKQEYLETKFRSGDACPLCNERLSKTNMANELTYIGCSQCGHKTGAYRNEKI